MSADNGIYIAKFPDGFRVAYAAAIENVDYFPVDSKERKEVLKDYFGESPVFQTQDDAFLSAKKMYDELQKDEEENGMGFFYLEYGISYIGEYESFN